MDNPGAGSQTDTPNRIIITWMVLLCFCGVEYIGGLLGIMAVSISIIRVSPPMTLLVLALTDYHFYYTYSHPEYMCGCSQPSSMNIAENERSYRGCGVFLGLGDGEDGHSCGGSLLCTDYHYVETPSAIYEDEGDDAYVCMWCGNYGGGP